MTEQTSEALRAWFKRVEPLYPELFNTAHVICGNYDQAEYALRSAILDVWAQNADGGMGFREKLRSAVRDEALRAASDGASEFTWPGFTALVDDPLIRQAARENIDTQRLLMLRHGVGLSPGRIAKLTGMAASQVRGALDRFEARCRRGLSAQERSRFDALFARAARRALGVRAGIPHPAAIYRAFEAEASQLQVSDHRLGQVVYRVLALAMAAICAVLFWLFAVLVQPPELANETGAQADIQAEAALEEAAPVDPVFEEALSTEAPMEESPAEESPAVSEANFAIDPPASIETTYQTEAPAQ